MRRTVKEMMHKYIEARWKCVARTCSMDRAHRERQLYIVNVALAETPLCNSMGLRDVICMRDGFILGEARLPATLKPYN